jgi:class I fructose-bisphosphate aldolase
MKNKTTTLTPAVEKILNNYGYESEGVLANLARMLMHGQLGGTGRMIVYPVDQGFEHGPARTFAPNPPSYDPLYLPRLAVAAGLNAYAGTPGQLMAAHTYAPQVPFIMKLNSASSLVTAKDNAITGTVDDALQLGCAAIGYTVYPGSEHYYTQVEKLVPIMHRARAVGLPTVLWSYPRGGNVSKDGETALDVVAYAARMAAEVGAHIIKVKLPTDLLDQPEAKKVYEAHAIPRATLAERVAHVVQCCFNGQRIVLFSGGATKGEDSVLDDARAIHTGGGNGSIIGRNATQRSEAEALKLLNDMVKIYKGTAAV